MGNTNKHTQREISKRASPERPPFRHSPPTRRASFKSPGQDVDELSCPARKTVCSNSPALSISAICTSNVRPVLLKALSAQKHPMHGEQIGSPSAANLRNRRIPAPDESAPFSSRPCIHAPHNLQASCAKHRRSSCVRKKIGVSERTSRVRLSASTSSVQRAKSARAIRVSRSKPISAQPYFALKRQRMPYRPTAQCFCLSSVLNQTHTVSITQMIDGFQ